MPFIQTGKVRNPFRTKAANGVPVLVWIAYSSPRDIIVQPRRFDSVGKTVYSSVPTEGEQKRMHGNFPKDANCAWTENSVIMGHDEAGRSPYVGYSFLSDATAAVEDLNSILGWIIAQPRAEPTIVTLLTRLRTLMTDAENIRAVDSPGQRIERIERAELFRQFLRENAVPHLSVTTPQYSMATSVEIKMPSLVSNSPEENEARKEVHQLLDALLLRLFPNNQNRPDPDPYADYYGYIAWSIR